METDLLKLNGNRIDRKVIAEEIKRQLTLRNILILKSQIIEGEDVEKFPSVLAFGIRYINYTNFSEYSRGAAASSEFYKASFYKRMVVLFGYCFDIHGKELDPVNENKDGKYGAAYSVWIPVEDAPEDMF